MNLLDEMELTHADCALLMERLEGVHGNKAARLREKLAFIRDRTVDVLDTEANVAPFQAIFDDWVAGRIDDAEWKRRLAAFGDVE